MNEKKINWKHVTIIFGIAIAFTAIFWIIDGILNYYYFTDILRDMLFETPDNVLETIITDINPYHLFTRISFFVACLLGAIFAIWFFTRERRIRGRLEYTSSELEKYQNQLEELVIQRTSELEETNIKLEKEIKEKIKAQHELMKEKEQLTVTLRSIGDGVITTDIETRIILINHEAEIILGLKNEDVIGKRIEEILKIYSLNNREPILTPVEQVIKTGKSTSLIEQAILVDKNGNEKLIDDSAAPILDAAGRIIGVIMVFRDITEKQRLEERMIKSQKAESLGLLAGGIAHDFNNLLTGIIGNIALAKKSDDLEVYKKRLQEAENASIRAKTLTGQLLTFAKGGAPVKEIADLKSIIIDSTEFSLSGSKIKCKYSIDKDLWKVEIDVGQISQVVNNLVINAIESMPKGGEINITAENVNSSKRNSKHGLKPGEFVKVTIEDQGVGIPEEYHSKIFDLYFTTKPYGTGLGLATVYSIIQRHNGYVDFQSEIDVGSKFYFYIPATHKDKKSIKEVKFKDTSMGSEKILILDDEEIILDILMEILTSDGYEVVTTKAGDETLSVYQEALKSKNPFDLVIIDLTIKGGMGGKETIEELTKLDPKVKAIVSSGYSEDQIMSNYKKFGFKGVLKKPYKTDELLNVIKQVLSMN